MGSVVQGCADTDGQVQTGTGVANLGTRYGRRIFRETIGRHGTTHRLGDRFIGLVVAVWSGGTEAFDGSVDDARIDFVDLFPGVAESCQHARSKVFHDDVAFSQQLFENFAACLALHVRNDRTLVAVQHGEVQAVLVRIVTQLFTCDVARRIFELDDVRSHPCQQLGRGRPRLYVGHVQNSYSG